MDGVSVDGDTVVLTLGTAATADDYVVISYTPPSDASAARSRDLAGHATAGFSATQTLNDTEEAPSPNSHAHWSAHHQRYGPGWRDADCEYLGHRRRRRTDQRVVRLPVDSERQRHGRRYS